MFYNISFNKKVKLFSCIVSSNFMYFSTDFWIFSPSVIHKYYSVVRVYVSFSSANKAQQYLLSSFLLGRTVRTVRVTGARFKSHVFPCCYSVNLKGVKEPDVIENIENRFVISKKCKYPLSNLLTRFILVGQCCRTDRKGKCVFQSEGKPLT